MTHFDALENRGSTGQSDLINVAFDSTELMKDGFKSGVYEKSFGSSNSDKLLLPPLKVDMASLGAESRLPLFSTADLDDRGRRTAIKAEQDVQNRMTPEQRKQLHEDKQKYDEAVASFKRADMMGALPFGYNKPPQKPESLKQYEKAVHAEIQKQDPKFFSNTYLIEGGFQRPSTQPRYEVTPEERRRWIQDNIKR